MLDTVIKNATIIDGLGNKSFVGDIGIQDGLIAVLGDASKFDAREVYDACGLVACPGFVDSHSHADYTALLPLSGYNALLQGVTTAVCGHCGTGPVPFCKDSMEAKRALVGDELFDYLKRACESYTTFTHALEQTPLNYNIALYIPHGAVREKVMGFSESAPTKAELEKMLDIVSEGMEHGALGFSTGLVYAPSIYATDDEIAAFAKTVSRYNGGYTSHIRNEGDHVEEAVAEAISVAERAGIPLTVSHLKIEGMKNRGGAPKLLGMLHEARARGVDAHADQYPYTAGSAPLVYQLPPKYLTVGIERVAETLSHGAPGGMERGIFTPEGGFESAIYAAGYDGTMITMSPGMEELEGLTLTEAARKLSSSPFEALCNVIAGTKAAAQGIYFAQGEDDLLTIMRDKIVACGTDWMDLIGERDEAGCGGAHPRATASMPRRIRLLMDDGKESLESIIMRMTSMSADMAGLHDTGRLVKDGRADITVFDPRTISDNADYVHPYKSNTGIEYVFVSGVKAVEKGALTNKRAGKYLKRQNKREER